MKTPPTRIRRARGAAERRECARIMSSTEPWITLGRDFDACLKLLNDPFKELYVAARGKNVLGLIFIVMRGSFVGYIQSIAVTSECRGQGLGSKLIAFAEKRIFSESPNAFICVSSFNPRARRLYEELGYSLVGELKDFVVPGLSEFLLRKTIGPLKGFRPRAA